MKTEISMRPRRLFGIDLASDFPFATCLGAGEGPPEMTFAVCLEVPESPVWQQSPPVYVSPLQTESGESASLLYRTPDFEVLRFPELLDFYLWTGRIACHLLEPRYHFLIELRLLGPVLAYWLESRGVPALHASAVAVKGRTAAFLSTHGAGKTGLAAALMQAGCELLTDDLLPIEEQHGTFLGRPGYPQMRMWPDEAFHFLGDCEELPLVHPELSKRRVPVGPDGFGTFHDAPLPLACLYVPERRPDRNASVEIRAVSRLEALIELVRHSFSPYLVEAAGLQPSRFDFFARLVREVPVRRLSYPSGFDRLPEVADAVLRDLEC
jgi:hypothetical protein